ncbi:MAG: hypothetical protein ABIF77_05510 [bacterium]
MSKSGINLTDRRVVLTVVTLLVVVAAFNLNYFKSNSGPGDAQQNEEEFPVPSDLGTATLAASDQLLSLPGWGGNPATSGEATEGADGAGSPAQDPFHQRLQVVATLPEPVSAESGAAGALAPRPQPASPRKAQLRCTAVLLGGDLPVAFINERPYHLDDRVGNYRIVQIDTDGVLLRSSQQQLLLPVANKGDSGTYCPIVTSLPAPNTTDQQE